MAQLFETAAIAFGLAGVADLAAMVDELVGEGDPMVLGQDAHEFLLDFLGCIPFGEAKAAGNAEDMGVDDDAFGLVEADAEDDVGGLRLRSGVNRSGRSRRHWRALLRRKGQKGLRHEISAPLPRQSFRGLGRSGIPRP